MLTELFTAFEFIDTHSNLRDVLQAVCHEHVIGVGASGYLNISHKSKGIQSHIHLAQGVSQ